MSAIITSGPRRVYPLASQNGARVIVAAMLFFGCAYHPWRGLDAVPAMKYIVLVNPLVYVAEGMRGTLTPEIPHMPLAVSMTTPLLISIVFRTFGYRSFHKRAIG